MLGVQSGGDDILRLDADEKKDRGSRNATSCDTLWPLLGLPDAGRAVDLPAAGIGRPQC
jgi:hypothetical protein